MKERPILFSGPMVRALLDGRKTQTRRVVKSRPWTTGDYFASGEYSTDLGYEASRGEFWAGFRHPSIHPDGSACYERCPYGAPGDRLWVRETWRSVVAINPPGKTTELGVARYVPDQQYCRRVEFQATQARDSEPWRPSIHMPRWASRITLEVTGVRVERLQDITEADAAAEGVESLRNEGEYWKDYLRSTAQCDELVCLNARDSFWTLWDSLNAARGFGWDANPWVWVVEFTRIN
jgi:hypothetical protein